MPAIVFYLMYKKEKLILVKNAIANVIRGGATALVAIALPPFLTRLMSPSAFGAWVLILQLSAFVGYLDFGIQTAVGRFVAHANERGDTEHRDRIVNTSLAVLSLTCLVCILATAIAAFLQAQGTEITFDQLLQQAGANTRDALKAYALPPNRPTQAAYESALIQRLQIREEIRGYFQQHGLIALAFPPVMVPPPKIGQEAEVEIRGQKVSLLVAMGRNTALGSCASMAGLVLPAGMTSNGLPVGLEFDALTGNDRGLLALGLSVEKVLDPIPAPGS